MILCYYADANNKNDSKRKKGIKSFSFFVDLDYKQQELLLQIDKIKLPLVVLIMLYNLKHPNP